MFLYILFRGGESGVQKKNNIQKKKQEISITPKKKSDIVKYPK